MTFDDNAMFRHKDLGELRDLSEEEPAEVRAGKAGLSYVKLDGNIGCLVNGAGLAMSTMDLIKLHGGEPANFLDVGGGANVEQVTEAFRILLDDKNTKAVLVNIFGGIMRCTTIATAVLEAYKLVGFNVPLVVRLEGHRSRARPQDAGRKQIEHHQRQRADRRGQESRRRGQARRCQLRVAGSSIDSSVRTLSPRTQRFWPFAHEHSDQQTDPRRLPGHHRQGRTVSHQGLPRVRHANRRRRHAGQGRRDGRGRPGVRHRHRSRRSRPGPTPR